VAADAGKEERHVRRKWKAQLEGIGLDCCEAFTLVQLKTTLVKRRSI
jgi:hypothetical protein